MFKSFIALLFASCLLLLGSFNASAQNVKEPAISNVAWTNPFPAFRIAGNLYYVGTEDLACFLITTNQGNILINTGTAVSTKIIKDNIELLGFKLADTKILLTTQAHYDHVGAMAAIKKMTGAQLMADEKDAPVLGDGGSSDYQFGGNGSVFEPVTVDRKLHDKEIIQLGEMQVQILHHPGHTKGSCGYLFTVKDNEKSWRVFIANMPTIITQKPFAEVTSYPEIAKDYAYTLMAMKNIKFDIWLASHASQFKLSEKHKPGEAYNPSAFIDQKGYDIALSELQKEFVSKK